MLCCTINNNNSNDNNSNNNNNNDNNNNNRKVDSLVQTVTIFSNDVGMDLGINKIMSCACEVHFQKIQKIITYYTWQLTIPSESKCYIPQS